jgi:hypothetical protein
MEHYHPGGEGPDSPVTIYVPVRPK